MSLDCDPIATPLAGTPDAPATPCDPIAPHRRRQPRGEGTRQRRLSAMVPLQAPPTSSSWTSLSHIESSPTGWSSPRRLAGRPHHRRRSHGTLRTRGPYPCSPSSECLPWSLPLGGQSAAVCAADWPPSREWSGRAERCASRD
jgi:hypothetical protein